MSIAFKNGDMFSSNADILCHQVNCMGRMGSGIAKTVREKFPNVYEAYMMLSHADGVTPDDLLGTVQFVKCGTQIIANLFAQRNYGYDGNITEMPTVYLVGDTIEIPVAVADEAALAVLLYDNVSVVASEERAKTESGTFYLETLQAGVTTISIMFLDAEGMHIETLGFTVTVK